MSNDEGTTCGRADDGSQVELSSVVASGCRRVDSFLAASFGMEGSEVLSHDDGGDNTSRVVMLG